MEVKRNHREPARLCLEPENISEITPQVGFVDTVIGNNNLIVHQLLEQQASKYPVLLTLFRRANGVVIASLRSRNVSAEIAEKLQGGGHPNAAPPLCPLNQDHSDGVNYLRQTSTRRRKSR